MIDYKMNTEEKIKIMQAFLDGEEIEVMDPRNKSITTTYAGLQEPVWNWWSFTYRIKEKDCTLPVPWELIGDTWQWAAMDEDGKVHFYLDEPNAGCSEWYSDYDSVGSPLKIETPDTKHWKKTLTKRPEPELLRNHIGI